MIYQRNLENLFSLQLYSVMLQVPTTSFFPTDYQPHLDLAKDFSILTKTVNFATDVQNALKEAEDEAEEVKIHALAGPPYEKDGPQLPNVLQKRRR